ncbi:hypothetical protein WA026_015146 [Henosepilachna vigintioctopunctata]|uniref:Uncharacterized protein n=1 Tax=Henosepilachna vigintioctopunctata TaxID=420089 RepID=A0AAW1TU90_9CUCU
MCSLTCVSLSYSFCITSWNNSLISQLNPTRSEVVSHDAAKFKNDPSKMDFSTKLLNCYVPPDLEVLLDALSPTYDPQRRLQLYVPSFAGLSFELNFERCLPPSMLILAYHLLASIRTNSDPEEILLTFYATTILTMDDLTFTPANFFGAYLDRNQRPTNHINWIKSRFERVFHPVVGRVLLQRPTLAKIHMHPQEYDAMD